jgi:hypothetical protein
MPMPEREENTGNPRVKPKLSYRPSKETIETLQITTETSTSVGIMTEEDNFRLIRAKECFKLATWNEIQVTLFPKRTLNAIRVYYGKHLKSVDDVRSISVPKTRLFGCDPLKKPLITSNATSHTSTTMKSSALQGTSTILPPEILTFDSPNISHPSSYQLSKAPKGEKRFTDTDEADSVVPAKKAKNGLALHQKKSAPAKKPAVISSKLPKSDSWTIGCKILRSLILPSETFCHFLCHPWAQLNRWASLSVRVGPLMTLTIILLSQS